MCQVSALPLTALAAGAWVEQRTAEYRMSNVEGMYSARRELLCRTVYFIKKTEQSETTLRHSAVRRLNQIRLSKR
jgi:hypothetical protein